MCSALPTPEALGLGQRGQRLGILVQRQVATTERVVSQAATALAVLRELALQRRHARPHQIFFAVQIVQRKLSRAAQQPLHLFDLLPQPLRQARLLGRLQANAQRERSQDQRREQRRSQPTTSSFAGAQTGWCVATVRAGGPGWYRRSPAAPDLRSALQPLGSGGLALSPSTCERRSRRPWQRRHQCAAAVDRPKHRHQHVGRRADKRRAPRQHAIQRRPQPVDIGPSIKSPRLAPAPARAP